MIPKGFTLPGLLEVISAIQRRKGISPNPVAYLKIATLGED
jgi:hypothetical protein